MFLIFSDTVGVKLLMKMGWKPGQGVGPRITKKEKKIQRKHEKSVKKVYGCSLPTNVAKSDSESSESEFDIDLNDITFAPDDYQPYVVNPKQNAFGLGYEGMDRKPVLSSNRPELSVLTVAGKSIRGQVGICYDSQTIKYRIGKKYCSNLGFWSKRFRRRRR